ncbi:hypothetical protein F5B22DRAFT_27530 [Xylaria bambusicola]|uniref:uncharacterized protein n=1 Tax=Xylaria bambusicola TaxID=326684 RepID=UPI002007BDB6|nr:uncharacterized protein F5B22DRAFT_27530 [Xylaria bambusicola]KAI0528232.1 hypothetical protein F5B22DRAFT_27530 [Xylaria bambusicola]
MASKIVRFCLVTGYLALRASAACAVYGVDYSNGGSYNIDPSSDASFTFTTIFQTCVQESIKPVLVDPTGHQYTCSAINTTPDGQEQKSTCGIAYSSMSSGQWKIVLSGTNVAVQRVINLTLVSPSTVTVTATPTVIVGITSTPNPTTIFSTIGTQTQTLILAPGTVTTPCIGSTTTLTVTPTKATSVTVSTIVRTTTDAIVTRESTTTVVKTAYCHYTDDGGWPAPPPNTICVGLACGYPPDLPTPTICVGFSCGKQTGTVPDTPTTSSVEVLKILATTITVTETTYTVTQTSITQLPAPTVTESVIKITTATVTPQPSTVCGGQKPGVTISLTLPQATVTQTSLSYSTRHATGTVTVVSTKTSVTTNARSATSCWLNGGWMGAD